MALTDRLRNLDQRILPGTRDPEEGAEDYLRRVATGRAISPAQLGDVQTALQEMFGISSEQESGSESGPEPSPDQAEGERGDAPDADGDSSETGGAEVEPESAPDQAEGER